MKGTYKVRFRKFDELIMRMKPKKEFLSNGKEKNEADRLKEENEQLRQLLI